MAIKQKIRVIAAGVLGFVAFFGLWSWLSTQMTPTRLPGPLAVFTVLRTSLLESRVIEAVGGGSHGFLPHIWATCWLTLVAVTAGALLGCVLGWMFATLPVVRWFVQAPVEILRLVPSLMAVPFFVLWFGIGPIPEFILIVAYTALVMQVATFVAVRDFPPNFIHFARTLGASRATVAWTVLVPGALPGLLGSLRVALQLSWGLTVVAELMGAQVGVGRIMSSMSVLFRTDHVITGVVWIAAIAAGTDALFRWMIRRVTAWSRD